MEKKAMHAVFAMLILLLCAVPLAVSGQESGGKAQIRFYQQEPKTGVINPAKNDKDYAAPAHAGKAITTRAVMTSRFQRLDSDESQKEGNLSKGDMKNAKQWIEVVIPFKLELPSKVSKGAQSVIVENVKVKVEALFPLREKVTAGSRAYNRWGLFAGTANLYPFEAVMTAKGSSMASYHQVRMYMPPWMICRIAPREYLAKKWQIFEEMPLRITVTMNDAAYVVIREPGKKFIEEYKKGFDKATVTEWLVPGKTVDLFRAASMETGAGGSVKLYDNAFLPAADTPWAWFEFDKFETLQPTLSGSK